VKCEFLYLCHVISVACLDKFSKNLSGRADETTEEHSQHNWLTGQDSLWLVPYAARLCVAATVAFEDEREPHDLPCVCVYRIFLRRLADVLFVINFRWYSFRSSLIAQF
jgi:hypothetical protein